MSQKFEPYSRRASLQDRINDSERMLARSEHQQGITNLHAIRTRVEKDKENLEKITPPSIGGDERGELKVRQGKLEEAIINGKPEKGFPEMPSKQQMWDNQAGDSNQHFQHEQYIKNHNLDEGGNLHRIEPRDGERGMWDEWKDGQRVLGKEQEEYATDMASVELLRPVKRKSGDMFRYSHQPYSGLSADQVAEVTGRPPTEVEVLADSDEVTIPTPAEMFNKTHVPEPTYTKCKYTTTLGFDCKGTPVRADLPYCKAHKKKHEDEHGESSEENS